MGRIADDLVELVTTVLADLADPERGVAPGLALPATLAGHRVDADAHADLVFTLGLLREAGVERIGDLDVEAVLRHRLAATDAAAHPHVLLVPDRRDRGRGWAGLDALDPAIRDVRGGRRPTAPSGSPLLDEGVLPRNYAVVLARCELARSALGPRRRTPAVLDGLVDRVGRLLGEHPDGWLDDSHTGRGQVDMYTVDAYLFAEPFADRLGDGVGPAASRSAARPGRPRSPPPAARRCRGAARSARWPCATAPSWRPSCCAARVRRHVDGRRPDARGVGVGPRPPAGGAAGWFDGRAGRGAPAPGAVPLPRARSAACR